MKNSFLNIKNDCISTHFVMLRYASFTWKKVIFIFHLLESSVMQ